jgi:hypothetical protein
MTYEKRYTIRSIKGKKDIRDLTLYEATKTLARLGKENLVNDATRITVKNGSFVGFYCLWENQVKAAFQANSEEKYLINQWKQ